MSKRRIIVEKKIANTAGIQQAKKAEIFTPAHGWNSMTNWLTVLVFVLPVLFSRFTMDPAISVRYIFLSIFILLFLLYFYVRKKINFVLNTPVKSVFVLGICFGIWSMVSLFFAINPSAGYYETARHFLNMIFLFLICVMVQREELQLLKICKAILLMSLIQSFVGIMQYYELAFVDLPGADPKPYGLMANRNLFGSAQAFVLPFILLVLYKGSRTWKYLSGIAVAGIIISVFVSQTRSAWLAASGIFIISLILVLLFSKSNRKKWLVNSIISVPIIALLTGLVIISDKENKFTESIKQRAHSLVEVSTKVSTTAEEGGNERLKMWLLTSRLIRDHSLSGVGPGNWKIEIPKYDTAGLIWPTGKFVPTRPHNDYLQIASETGIPGILLYLGMWILISVIAFKIILRPGTEDQRILGILLLSGIGGFAIDSMFSFPTERIEHSMYIYLMAGIILGNYLSIKEKDLQKVHSNKILLLTFLVVTAFNIFLGYEKYNFEKHMNYAKAYENNKNYEEELAEVDAGKTNFVTISPEGMPIEVRSSIAYKELKDYKNALAEILIAKKYNPNSTMIYNNLGTIYTEMKDFNNAIESYERALKLSPRSDITLKNLSINYFNTENYAACIEALNRVEDKVQDSAYLNNLLNEAKRRLALQSK